MPFGRRAQQWTTFARMWHIINAYKQPPDEIADIAVRYILGKHKPIFHSSSNCGDHVVVVNSKEIAFPGNMWEEKVFTEHSGRPKGKLQIPAFEVHAMDPTWIVKRTVYAKLAPTKEHRRMHQMKLHVFEDENVPEDIMKNISNVLPQPRRLPKSIFEYSEEEIKKFPKLWIPAKDFLKT